KVNMTHTDLTVCIIVRLKYSFANQKATSLGGPQAIEALVIAITISSGVAPVAAIIGIITPDAVSTVTVADPTAKRSIAATIQARIYDEMFHSLVNSAI